MDKSFQDAAINSTKNCFSMMMMINAEAKEAFVVNIENVPHSDYSAIIGLAGGVEGWIAARLSEEVVYSIINALLSISKEEAEEYIQDAVGEFINIIAGAFKTSVAKGAEPIKISIPSIITGKDHELSPSASSEYVSIPFSSDIGDLNIDLCLKIK